MARRVSVHLAAGWLLVAGLVYLGSTPEAVRAAQLKEAKKYTEQLKSARTSKEKVVALQELGRLAAAAHRGGARGVAYFCYDLMSAPMLAAAVTLAGR